jgi:hypothetical protein
MPKRGFEQEKNQEAISSSEKRRKVDYRDVPTLAANLAKRKLAHDDYTVGWICLLEVEQIAALEMARASRILTPTGAPPGLPI